MTARVYSLTIIFCSIFVGGFLLSLTPVSQAHRPVSENTNTFLYLFAGHTYQSNTKIDFRLEGMDLEDFDAIWLGGDTCAETLLDSSTLVYIDEVFDVRNPTTQWTLGNHDYRNGNLEWYRSYTGKNTFSVNDLNGIVLMTMDTNLTPADCENLDAQFEMISDICDTIKTASHLVLLMHNDIWYQVPGLPGPWTYANTSFRFWNVNCSSSQNTFINSIYPMLKTVQSRGIDVICVLGDAGIQGRKGADMVSDDGIYFLASGLNNSTLLPDTIAFENAPKDKVLIFEHQPKLGQLEWNFHDLDSLYAQ